MPKKSSPTEMPTDPLTGVTPYDPDSKEEKSSPADPIAEELLSPLEPPPTLTQSALTSIEGLLREANRRIEQLQNELVIEKDRRRQIEQDYYKLKATAEQTGEITELLEKERERRIALERQMAAIETEAKHAQSMADMVETERQARLELERQVSSLQSRVELLSSASEDLAEEREKRLQLERDRATLEMEVRQARKLEQFLTEERQARANAQMRASTAEARIAQLEGELSAMDKKRKKSFLNR